MLLGWNHLACHIDEEIARVEAKSRSDPHDVVQVRIPHPQLDLADCGDINAGVLGNLLLRRLEFQTLALDSLSKQCSGRGDGGRHLSVVTASGDYRQGVELR